METALIASEYILAKTKPKLPLQLMSMLGGLDYGPSSTGEDYSEAWKGMIQTYKAWSNGRLNTQLNGEWYKPTKPGQMADSMHN